MKLWCKIKTDNRIVAEKVLEFAETPSGMHGWYAILKDVAQEFDLACPVLLSKHVNDLACFYRVTFKQADFMEPIMFDRFEIELIREKKPNNE